MRLNRSLVEELAPDVVTLNALSSGILATDMT
jgi:hypothetical protein